MSFLSGKYLVKLDVFGNVPCTAVVDTRDLALQVRGQNDGCFEIIGFQSGLSWKGP